MRTSLVTTTINVPNVLRLYRQFDECVSFYVMGDLKTPPKTKEFCEHIPNCRYYGPQDQRDLGYACSDLVGWNCIQRRSIGLLEAAKDGADAIVMLDDDNVAMSTDYFDRFEMVLGSAFSGLKISNATEWFDPGLLLVPRAPHRGMPFGRGANPEYTYAVDAKVGVAAGMCLGDPDISAVERIANHPVVHGVSELLRAGVAVDPNMHTVFNSQNSAFIRELLPCFLLVPQFQRFDDIFASLIAQRVMRERNLHVHFGQPFVWQQRNAHNLVSDLKAEMLGMEHVTHFAEFLDGIDLGQAPIVNMVRLIHGQMSRLDWMPDGVSALASAWLDDCEKVL